MVQHGGGGREGSSAPWSGHGDAVGVGHAGWHERLRWAGLGRALRTECIHGTNGGCGCQGGPCRWVVVDVVVGNGTVFRLMTGAKVMLEAVPVAKLNVLPLGTPRHWLKASAIGQTGRGFPFFFRSVVTAVARNRVDVAAIP